MLRTASVPGSRLPPFPSPSVGCSPRSSRRADRRPRGNIEWPVLSIVSASPLRPRRVATEDASGGEPGTDSAVSSRPGTSGSVRPSQQWGIWKRRRPTKRRGRISQQNASPPTVEGPARESMCRQLHHRASWKASRVITRPVCAFAGRQYRTTPTYFSCGADAAYFHRRCAALVSYGLRTSTWFSQLRVQVRLRHQRTTE